MAGNAVKTASKHGMLEYGMLAVGFGCMIGYVRLVSLGFVGYLEQGSVESTDPWYLLRSCAMLAALIACSGRCEQMAFRPKAN